MEGISLSKLKKFFIKNAWLLIPFFLNVMLHLLVLASAHISPFGDKISMYWDGYEQYLPYISFYKNGGGIGFSLQPAFGLDVFPLFCYYLLSPFNLIVFLFPNHLISEAIMALTVLKTAAAA